MLSDSFALQLFRKAAAETAEAVRQQAIAEAIGTGQAVDTWRDVRDYAEDPRLHFVALAQLQQYVGTHVPKPALPEFARTPASFVAILNFAQRHGLDLEPLLESTAGRGRVASPRPQPPTNGYRRRLLMDESVLCSLWPQQEVAAARFADAPIDQATDTPAGVAPCRGGAASARSGAERASESPSARVRQAMARAAAQRASGRDRGRDRGGANARQDGGAGPTTS